MNRIHVRSMLATITAALLVGSGAAQAAFPEKPLQLIIPFAPGGASDTVARILATEMSAELGQPVVVSNRAGGGTIVGAQAALASQPDGYTLFLSSNSTYTLNPAIRDDLTFDPAKDFQPIAAVGTIPNVLIVNAKQPWMDMKSLLEDAKAKPDEYAYGSYGVGTVAHFAGEMLKSATGANLVHVAYRGSGPAMIDLLSGQIPIAFDTVIATLPHMRSGAIRPLAVTSAHRASMLPDVPTTAELGYPEVNIESWLVLVAPVGVPQDVASRLSEAMKATLGKPTIQKRMKEVGLDLAADTTVTNWSERVSEEIQRLKAVAEKADINPN